MFESLVATLLNRFLGAYIENFDQNSLNIGIWSGDVKLKNLRLKKESLDKFNLPLDVKFGHLGELTLQIPWSNLKSKPVKVIIEDVYLLASPVIVENLDPDEEHKRELQAKQQKLAALEEIQKAMFQNQSITDDISTNETFAELLITKIVDNLQITIKNIHIRYEDDSLLTENPYSIGVTLDELSAVSADDLWIPSFISITQAFTHKLLILKSLSCYMNTDSGSIYSEDSEKLLDNFRLAIHKHDSAEISKKDLQYLLNPVSGKGRLTVHKGGTTESHPHVKGEFFFEEFSIDLDSDQYRSLLWTASKFHWFMKTLRFKKFRPKTTVLEDAKGWFRFAAQCILDEIHERNYKWSWAYFAKRRDQRKLYIKLWKMIQLQKLLSGEEKDQFDLLEDELPFEDIKFYRSLAHIELKRENLLQKTIIAGNNLATQKNNGWFGGWWGGKKAPAPTDQESTDEEDLQISEDQKKALYDAIDYSETQQLIEAVNLPKDRVTVELLTTLKRGAFRVKPSKSKPPLGEIVFEGCTAQFKQRPDSFLTNFQLREFRVEDGTELTLYKHIVSVKHAHGQIHDVGNDPVANVDDSDPFFQLSFEKNPLDGSADSKLLGRLRSMTIFYNPRFIEEIVAFFRPPKMHLDTIGAIMNAAEATVEGLTQQTRLGLQYALDEHKTVNVKLDLQAPLIFLPLRPNDWKSPVAILDAGHISVVSDLVNKEKIEEIKSKENYTELDWDQLTTFMYDQFNIHLQEAQFLVGPDIKSTTEQLHTKNLDQRPALILDRFSIKLNFGLLILPEALNLAKFKIWGEIPNIRLSLTDYQYKTIMSIIDVAIPDFEALDESEDYIFNTYGSSNENGGSIYLEADHQTKPDSKSVSSNSSLLAEKQHQFEFDFQVGLVHLSLLRCIDPVTLEAEPLIDLMGDTLSMLFWKTAKTMHLDLALKDMNVIDNIEKSGIPEFQNLVSSNKFVESDGKHSAKNLFTLDYTRSLRIVDFNSKEIEVFDQDVNVKLATVKFVITRMSVLSILNFVLNTFTDPSAISDADQLNHNDADDEFVAPQKINLQIDLDSIIVVLNEDGLKLSTLKLSTALIKGLILPEAMEFLGNLGALSLHDEMNHGSPRDSLLRSLISIEGDALAEFSYKSFDVKTNEEPFNSEVIFKSNSLKINFVEDAFNNILNYLSQFQKMKVIYDRARDAAIALAQLYDDAKNLKFDILVKAPVVVYPKLTSHSLEVYDLVTFHLGELYASNSFKQVDVLENIIELGIRNIKLVSDFHFESGVQSFEMIDDLDLTFKVVYVDEKSTERPTMDIQGQIPKIEMNLTELQLQFLKDFSDSLLRVVDVSDAEESTFRDVEIDAENANAVLASRNEGKDTVAKQSEVKEPESSDEVDSSDQKQVRLDFSAPQISLNIYNKTSNCLVVEENKLSNFSLNGLKANFELAGDGNFSADVDVHLFVVKDVRQSAENVFRDIIPSIEEDKNQFCFNINSDGTNEKRNITVVSTIQKPKTILALDYVFELQLFVDLALNQDNSKIPELQTIDDGSQDSIEPYNGSNQPKLDQRSKDQNTSTDSTTTFGFSINIFEPSLIILADSSKKNTDGVVFKIEQVMITSQNIISLGVNNIGMFLCNMEDFDSKNYRIIDDFSLSFASDSRGSNETMFLDKVQASIDPILIRVSLRDIRLATSIFQRATDYYVKAHLGNKEDVTPEDEYKLSEDFKRRLLNYAPSMKSNISDMSKYSTSAKKDESQVIINGEEFNASVGGLRFVLIGDIHELPVIDARVNPFEVKAINWSTELSAESHLETLINVYNYAKSSWEPLIEPWPIAVYANKNLEAVTIDVVSRTLAEISVTSRSVALLSKVFSLITDIDKTELKARGEDSPYRIINGTGKSIKVWVESDNDGPKRETTIEDGDSIPWEFENWWEVRENLDSGYTQGKLSLSILDSPYETVKGLDPSQEGESLYVLQPPINKVHNRLAFEVTLREDNVKIINIRSTVVLHNTAENVIDVSINGGKVNLHIPPEEEVALPIDYVYSGELKIRPHLEESSFKWSDKSFVWQDLLDGGLPVVCSSNVDKSSYYLQVEAVYEKTPLAQIYPHMKVVISAPVEIENLLPYDLNYRLYDKKSKKDWSGSIPKGVNSFVHVCSLSSLLLLSVEPQGEASGYGKSEFAIINAPKDAEFKRENSMKCVSLDGQRLELKLHYVKNKTSNTSLKVVVYSPYIILNKTGQDIVISEKGNITKVKGSRSEYVPEPTMFSFANGSDPSNRALVKINDSNWTEPLSFDAIGQSTSTRAQVNGKQCEFNFGLEINEGSGKYRHTKVVSMVPRYIFRNKLDFDLQLVENGSTKTIVVKAGEMKPLFGLRRIEKKSFVVKFEPSAKPWSAPFLIDDVGQIFLKVYKDNVGQVLLKVNTVLEGASMFIQIENASDNWPFSIRNFSDSDFYLYQADPNMNENGDQVKTDTNYKPIFYHIPAKSVMPYAYDYPNAIVKEVILRSHDRERGVNLAEIGNLKPFRLPQTANLDQAIVDLNVVVDETTQSLIISNYDPSVSLYKLSGADGAMQSSSTTNLGNNAISTLDKEDKFHTKVITKFEGFGISLINTRCQELCYITLRGIELRYNESDLLQNLSMKLKWIQIDNQLYGGIFPIVLYPSVLPKSSKEMNSHPSFSGSVSKMKDQSHGVMFIKYATVLLQEMTIEIDEDFLFALLDYAKFPGSIWDVKTPDVLYEPKSTMLIEPKSLDGTSDIYFEALHIQPALLNLSFVRTERINADEGLDNSQLSNTLMFFFNILTMAIGNINDAPIKLNALFIENVRVPMPLLAESVQSHYGQAFFYQVHKILGSADFLGNPVGLFNNLSSGVLDIFYEPYHGFVINDRPQEIGIGLAKGGLSFLKKSIFGFSDSFAKVTGSIAKGLSVATMDRKFQEQRRRNQRRNAPKHALYGFTNGANSFFESVSSGVQGIASAPMEGANESGALGFFVGLGKGVLGLPTKTAIGIFDLASNVSEGIRNTTTVFDANGLDKVRLPRYISLDKIVRSYLPREAQGQFWLKSIDGGMYINETYIAHLVLPGEEKGILVTYKRLILFNIGGLKSEWMIPFGEVKSISIESTGVRIGLKTRRNEIFIPISDKASRSFIYGKIGIAVNEFNKHCQVEL